MLRMRWLPHRAPRERAWASSDALQEGGELVQVAHVVRAGVAGKAVDLKAALAEAALKVQTARPAFVGGFARAGHGLKQGVRRLGGAGIVGGTDLRVRDDQALPARDRLAGEAHEAC